MSAPKSTPRPDEAQQNDETSKISALANVPLLISVIAVYAFFLASLYVGSLGEAFHFPIANLLTSIDYIQFIPQTLAIRKGIYAPLLSLAMPILFITFARQAFKLGQARGFALGRARARERAKIVIPPNSGLMSTANPTKPRQPRGLFKFFARVKARWIPGMMTGDDAWVLSKIIFWGWLLLALWDIAWDTSSNSGNFVRENLTKNGSTYTIYLKSAQRRVEGKLLLQSSMYLFAIRDQDNTIIAIPQTEVSSITAPLESPRDTATPTPSSASPATTVTRSPTASPTTSPVIGASPAPTATPPPRT